MTTTLVVRFVLGRYHATPWGRHVNEGQVELPPSPWRLLRALYAVWQTRTPDLDESTVHSLLGRLAVPPTYFVPPHQIVHTRHYYPDSASRSGTPSVDRTLDAFAVVERNAELAIRWPGDLSDEERAALQRLAEALPYVGRADSASEAWVQDDWRPSDGHSVCGPIDVGEAVGAGVEVRSLLAPELPLNVGALLLRPVDVRAGKLLFPPATRFVGYPAPQAWTISQGVRTPRTVEPVEAFRWTITSRVLPPETDAAMLTDRLRRAALHHLEKLRGQVRGDSLLCGRLVNGNLMTGHRHAHYVAVPNPERRIGEMVVWAPAGLAEEEAAALGRVQRLWAPEGMPGPPPVDVRLSAYGSSERVLADLAGPARRWQSVTPFVPPRHPKRDWLHFVVAEVQRELQHRGLPSACDVKISDHLDWRPFARYRPSKRFSGSRSDRSRSAPPGAAVEVTFDEPVTGPILLGHLSHFGLGLLAPRTAP